jgi:hypothetical protein
MRPVEEMLAPEEVQKAADLEGEYLDDIVDDFYDEDDDVDDIPGVHPFQIYDDDEPMD